MENITTGHWIFAGIFILAFVAFLFWSYQKDSASHKVHYKGAFRVTLFLVVLIFIIFIIKVFIHV